MSIRSQTSQPQDWAALAPIYTYEAKELGVKIKPPQLNYSLLGFNVINDVIFFGFNAIRDIGKAAARSIVRAKKAGPFKDVKDFLARVDRTKVTTRTFQSLVQAGAFDSMGYIRQDLLDNTEEFYEYFNKLQKYSDYLKRSKERIQEEKDRNLLIDRRDALRLKTKKEALTSSESTELNELEEMKLRRLVQLKEVENPIDSFPEIQKHKRIPVSLEELITQANYIGCYTTKHPAHILFPNTQVLSSLNEKEKAYIAGVVIEIKEIKTRKGDKMAFMKIGDETGTAEIIIFPRQYATLIAQGEVPKATQFVKVQGNCEAIDPDIKVIANNIQIYKG